MGFRLRKSIKIAPGIKVNVGKKSTGISVGGKYGGVSVNSKSGVHARTSIPGTGISYSSKLSSGKQPLISTYETNKVQDRHIHTSVAAKDSPTPIRTAEEMLDYCTKYNMGSGRFKAWDLKHLKLIEDAVEPDEAILTVFIGVHDYHSFWGINNSYAYAITSKRFLMAQKKAIGSVLDSMPLESVHFSCSSETHIGVITVVLLGRTFKIAVSKDSLTNIDYCIKSALSMAKDIAAN